MAKRFVSTEIWKEDWFLNIPAAYKLFWFYILGNCNHAGLFRVNVKSFNALMGVKINPMAAFEYFNMGKNRLRVVSDSVWLIEDFFSFQYGEIFNPNNKVHDSIEKAYNQYNINMTSIRGLKDLKDRVKDKDKDKDKYTVLNGGKKKLKGSEIKNGKVYFEDGSFQNLGKDQLALLEMGELKPKDILQGSIN
jgi:hypothetical protein